MSKFTPEQLLEINGIIEARLRHSRHENSDHLNAGLLPQKLGLGTGQIITGQSNNMGVALAAGTSGYALTSTGPGNALAYSPQDGVSAWTTITENTATYGAGIAHQWTGMFGSGVAGTGGDIAGRTNPMGFLLSDADFAAPAGRTLQYRIAATLWVNGATPSVNASLGITYITAVGGGVGALVPTFSSAWIGNQAVVVNPLLGNAYSSFSTTWGTGGFNNNVYMFGWLNSGGGGSTLANSLMAARVQLQYRHV